VDLAEAVNQRSVISMCGWPKFANSSSEIKNVSLNSYSSLRSSRFRAHDMRKMDTVSESTPHEEPARSRVWIVSPSKVLGTGSTPEDMSGRPDPVTYRFYVNCLMSIKASRRRAQHASQNRRTASTLVITLSSS